MSLIARGHGTVPHTFLPFLLPILGAAVKTIATTAITGLATNAISNFINPPPATPTAGPAEADLPSAEDVGAEEEEEEPAPAEEFTTEPDVGAAPIGGTAPPPLEVPPQLRAAVLTGYVGGGKERGHREL